jgi:hypothetical protein
MWAGKGWVRITVAVVGGISVLVQMLLVEDPWTREYLSPATLLLAFAISMVITSALVLMFQPAANLYFRSSSNA